MRKVTAGVFAIVALMLVLAGCKSDPVKEDVVNYNKNAMSIYNKYGADLNKKMAEATKAKNKEEYIAMTNKDVLPLFKEYKEKMSVVKPATKELQDIHNAYLATIASSEEGITLLVNSLSAGDKELFKSASEKVDAANKANDKFKKDFNDLAQKHKVKIE